MSQKRARSVTSSVRRASQIRGISGWNCVWKAFHQIEIDPDYRRILRFLWVDDITKTRPKIMHYQFCRLVFGLTPSPAILPSLMEQHLKEQSKEHQTVVSVLENSFYVDDFIGDAWDDSGLSKFTRKLTK